jgi:hypothetical protein
LWHKRQNFLAKGTQIGRKGLPLRQILSSIYKGDYGLAAELALSALEKSRLIRSRLNRDRIEKLYQQLLATNFRDRPLVAYLGVKLRSFDHSLA